MSQEKKSNFFEAIKTYKQILVIEPNHSEAKKKLKKFCIKYCNLVNNVI